MSDTYAISNGQPKSNGVAPKPSEKISYCYRSYEWVKEHPLLFIAHLLLIAGAIVVGTQDLPDKIKLITGLSVFAALLVFDGVLYWKSRKPIQTPPPPPPPIIDVPLGPNEFRVVKKGSGKAQIDRIGINPKMYQNLRNAGFKGDTIAGEIHRDELEKVDKAIRPAIWRVLERERGDQTPTESFYLPNSSTTVSYYENTDSMIISVNRPDQMSATSVNRIDQLTTVINTLKN